MKTAIRQHAVNSPLQVVETIQIPEEKNVLQIISKNQTDQPNIPPQTDQPFQTDTDWDPSWFANYE